MVVYLISHSGDTTYCFIMNIFVSGIHNSYAPGYGTYKHQTWGVFIPFVWNYCECV